MLHNGICDTSKYTIVCVFSARYNIAIISATKHTHSGGYKDSTSAKINEWGWYASCEKLWKQETPLSNTSTIMHI